MCNEWPWETARKKRKILLVQLHGSYITYFGKILFGTQCICALLRTWKSEIWFGSTLTIIRWTKTKMNWTYKCFAMWNMKKNNPLNGHPNLTNNFFASIYLQNHLLPVKQHSRITQRDCVRQCKLVTICRLLKIYMEQRHIKADRNLTVWLLYNIRHKTVLNSAEKTNYWWVTREVCPFCVLSEWRVLWKKQQQN